MDFKITFYLDKRRATKAGKFPLKLRVYSVIEKKTVMFSIGKELSKEEFDGITSSKTPKKLQDEKIAIDAINRAGTAIDGEAIREALQNTMQFKGASGTISFDDHGDPIKSVAIKGITNGKTESIFTTMFL